jgi:hypothetical protein
VSGAVFIAAAAAAALLAGCTLGSSDAGGPGSGSAPGSAGTPAPAGEGLQVSPGANGSCSAASPCSLDAALDRAGSGATITLAAGDYGDLDLTGFDHLGDVEENVTIVGADGGESTFGRLETSVPHVTWRGIRVTGVWFLNAGADGSIVENSHLDGTGLFVRSDHTVVRDTEFEGGSSVDGIQVGGANDVLLEGNTVHDYDQGKDNGLHADCIQVFDSSSVRIIGNDLANCYNAGIITSSGRGTGIADLTIEGNYVRGCVVKTDACQGGSAADLRYAKTTGLTVRNNTFLYGSVRIDPLPDMVFDRNIVGYISTCDATMTNSVIEAWNERTCDQPDAAGSNGNRTGEVSFVDREGGDLRPTSADTAAITPSGDGLSPVETDFSGEPMPADVAGAAAPTS